MCLHQCRSRASHHTVWISKLTLSRPESSLNHFTSKRTCLTSIYNTFAAHDRKKRGVGWRKTNTHTRSLTQVSHKVPLPPQVFTVCHNHKKTSSLRTNCASPNFLITSCGTTVVFLKITWVKSKGFPTKILATTGCRVFTMCVLACVHPLFPPPHLPVLASS